jgi:ArsR family metal-binding transcriptional regulator
MYGEYPPHSSLSYVWANREDPETIVTSPYTDKAKMVLLEKGQNKVGTWQDEEVNILEDYQKAFGTKPPARARIAVMNDSDNTGESSVSYVEYIEVMNYPPLNRCCDCSGGFTVQ